MNKKLHKIFLLMMLSIVGTGKAFATDYICDVATATFSSYDDAKAALTDAGYTVLTSFKKYSGSNNNGDIDQGCNWGYYTLVGYKTSSNVADAIGNLIIQTDQTFSSSYTIGDYTYNKAQTYGESYFNENTHYAVYYTKTRPSANTSESLVTGIDVFGGSGSSTDCDVNGVYYDMCDGYSGSTESNAAQDLNAGCGHSTGHYMYIGMTKTTHSHSNGYKRTVLSNWTGCDCGYIVPNTLCTFEYENSGTGTESDPYLISSKEELFWFTMKTLSSPAICGKLTEDIVFNDGTFDSDGNWSESGNPDSWECLGGASGQFQGIFDGDGHTISGLYMNTTNDYNAFCGHGYKAEIKNLGIIDSYISGNSYTAGICGYADYSTITKCYFLRGGVSGTADYTGGICGYSKVSTCTYCYANTSVSSSASYAGGICGMASYDKDNYNNDLEHCSPIIKYCYTLGSVKANDQVGGITGYFPIGYMISCFSLSNITITGSDNGYSGGLSGHEGANFHDEHNYTNKMYGRFGTGPEDVLPDEAFSNGRATYLLNNAVTDGTQVWYQTIGTDPYPTWGPSTGNNTVYYDYASCSSTDKAYVNAVAQDHTYDANGYCTKNSDHCQPAPLVGDYYEISNQGQLYWFSDQVNNCGHKRINGKLAKDIVINAGTFDANGNWSETGTPKTWARIGTGSDYFAGTFDGDGHTVSGLYFSNSRVDNVGLFASSSGTLKNIGVINSYFNGAKYVGALCGDAGELTTNCYSKNNICVGTRYVGGLVGSTGATTSNCYAIANVSCPSAEGEAGGICGRHNTDRTIINCYSAGSVYGKQYAGGLCGYNFGGNLYYSYSIAKISGGTATDGEIGGITGHKNSTQRNPITKCCYTNQDVGYSGGEQKTDAQFASGEVAFLLNASTNTGAMAWGQDLENEPYPLLTAEGVHYNRTNANRWGTLVLPYDMNYTAGGSDYLLYYLSSVSADGTTMSFKEYTDGTIAAGTPVVIYKKDEGKIDIKPADTPNFSTTITPSTTEVDGWTMNGTYTALTNQTGMYFIANNCFWKAESAITLNPFRAWFETTSSSSAKVMTILVDEGDATSVLKVENGELKAEDSIYNLNGQKLSVPVKGQVNIINGKKILVK